MEKKGVSPVFHYLDNLPWGLCARPIANIGGYHSLEEGNGEGPSSTITFQGMELDSENMEIRLPPDKLEQLQQLLSEWEGRKAGKKRNHIALTYRLHTTCNSARILISTRANHPIYSSKLWTAIFSFQSN